MASGCCDPQRDVSPGLPGRGRVRVKGKSGFHLGAPSPVCMMALLCFCQLDEGCRLLWAGTGLRGRLATLLPTLFLRPHWRWRWGWAASSGLSSASVLSSFDVCSLNSFLIGPSTYPFTGAVIQSFSHYEAGLRLIFHLYCLAQCRARRRDSTHVRSLLFLLRLCYG